ncbi:MAG: cytochrome c [Pirellulaceae bacterium]|nr:MAG: cytochrome c [Pirellulaceae bacterium]
MILVLGRKQVVRVDGARFNMMLRLLRFSPWVGLVVACLVGCRNAVDSGGEYPIGAELAQVPAGLKKQILHVLEERFGSLDAPRFELPDPEHAAELGWKERVAADRLTHGMSVYRRYCAGCHGVAGDGAGPASPYLLPKPRDYRRGVFKFTSTPYGSKPRRQDLIRTVRYGAKGTAMPDFKFLPAEDLQPLVDYVIMLSIRGELESLLARVAADYGEEDTIEPEVIWEQADLLRAAWDNAALQLVLPVTPRPAYTDESIALGRQAFLENECFKCHGRDGRGQTAWLDPRFVRRQMELPESQREPLNYDAWGQIAPAADLTAGMLHGGRRPIDVYRRIYSGINGTPMPGFAQKFADQPETIWHLVHFVLSLTEGRTFSEATSDEPQAGG